MDHLIVSTNNLTGVVILIFVSVIAFRLWRRIPEDADYQWMLLGASMVTGGLAIHRLHWAIVRLLALVGYQIDFIAGLPLISTGIVTMAMLIVTVGSIFLIAPALHSWFDEDWGKKTALACVALYCVILAASVWISNLKF